LLLLVGNRPAAADDRAAAREHYQKGTAAFDLGAYEEAINEYGAAYRLKNDPALLYNLGQAHRLAGHTQDALRFYKVYLNKLPNAVNRAEVELKIGELQKLLEAQQRTASLPPDAVKPMGSAGTETHGETRPKPPEPTPPVVETKPVEKPPEPVRPVEKPPEPVHPVETHPVETHPVETPPAVAPSEPAPTVTATEPAAHPGRTKTIAGAAVAAVGIAALAAGIALGALAQSAGDDLTKLNDNHGTFDPAKQDAGKTDQAVSGAMLGIGGAAVAAGVVVLAIGRLEAKKARAATSAKVLPLVGPRGAGASLQVSF
jgi:tetratricopeptide (TPR) repeat protein